MPRLLASALLLPFLCACSFSAIVDGEKNGAMTTVKNGFVSTHILELGNGEAVVFDAGSNASATPTVSALADLGLTAEDVTAVFATHGHGDHVGGLGAFPNARIYAMGSETEEWGAPEGIHITDPLSDGDSVELTPELSVDVFHTPGHTPGHAIFLVGGILVMGDAAVATKQGGIATTPKNFATDFDEMVATLDGLGARLDDRSGEIQTMVFGHSGSLDNFQALLDYEP